MRTGLNREWREGAMLAKLAVGASLSALMVTSANADVGVSANIELDTDYIQYGDGEEFDADDDFDMGGRVKVSITGDHSVNDTVVLSGVGQLLIKKDGSTGVDDAFIRLGSDTWGVKFGRYEAIDLHSKGTDTLLILSGLAANYQANAARGRISDAGQIGLEISPSDRFSFMLDTVWGETDSPDTDVDQGTVSGRSVGEDAIAGFRPAVQFDITDDLRLTAGYDYLEDGASETKGVGVYLRYATDAFALKFSVADGEKETAGATDWENTTFNLNVEFGDIGLGLMRSEDDGGGTGNTLYGRYLFRDLMGNENASAQLGFSYLDEEEADGTSLDETIGLRLRFFYEF